MNAIKSHKQTAIVAIRHSAFTGADGVQ